MVHISNRAMMNLLTEQQVDAMHFDAHVTARNKHMNPNSVKKLLSPVRKSLCFYGCNFQLVSLSRELPFRPCLPNLREFVLAGHRCDISTPSLAALLRHMPNLRMLDLSHSKLQLTSPIKFTAWHLVLTWVRLKPKFIEKMGSCFRNVRILDLRGVNFGRMLNVSIALHMQVAVLHSQSKVQELLWDFDLDPRTKAVLAARRKAFGDAVREQLSIRLPPVLSNEVIRFM